MLKPVKSVIASARVLIRRPSEAKLATEDLRLLLHQTLEELHSLCLKDNADFFTHDFEIEFTYNATSQGFTFTLDSEVNGCSPETTEIHPVYLRYQALTDDPDEGSWTRVNISHLTNFANDKAPGLISVAMLGNTWQHLTSPQFKINAKSDWVAQQRWRIACRVFPTDVLDMETTVPFPAEFTSLVETMLAGKALPLVKDDSQSWMTFVSMQRPSLMMQEAQGIKRLKDWLGTGVENRMITLNGYDYRSNNAQAPQRRGGYRVEW